MTPFEAPLAILAPPPAEAGYNRLELPLVVR